MKTQIHQQDDDESDDTYASSVQPGVDVRLSRGRSSVRIRYEALTNNILALIAPLWRPCTKSTLTGRSLVQLLISKIGGPGSIPGRPATDGWLSGEASGCSPEGCRFDSGPVFRCVVPSVSTCSSAG